MGLRWAMAPSTSNTGWMGVLLQLGWLISSPPVCLLSICTTTQILLHCHWAPTLLSGQPCYQFSVDKSHLLLIQTKWLRFWYFLIILTDLEKTHASTGTTWIYISPPHNSRYQYPELICFWAFLVLLLPTRWHLCRTIYFSTISQLLIGFPGDPLECISKRGYVVLCDGGNDWQFLWHFKVIFNAQVTLKLELFCYCISRSRSCNFPSNLIQCFANVPLF